MMMEGKCINILFNGVYMDQWPSVDSWVLGQYMQI